MGLSISDDDLCSECTECLYRPGEKSDCNVGFPGQFDSDGYCIECTFFSKVLTQGDNWDIDYLAVGELEMSPEERGYQEWLDHGDQGYDERRISDTALDERL